MTDKKESGVRSSAGGRETRRAGDFTVREDVGSLLALGY